MQEYLTIGVITKPQGIRGEVKLRPLTDDLSRFKTLKEVFIDGKPHKVLSARITPDAVLISLNGIFDRNGAELLRGKEVKVDRENAVQLKKDTFFIVDVIGCKVITEDGEIVGEVKDVTSAKTDIFTISCVDGRIMRFPFLKTLLVSASMEEKTIVVNKKRLGEVSVYED